MPSRVLVPYDASPLADRALRYAFETFPDAAVVVLHVVEPFATHSEAGSVDIEGRWWERAEELAQDVLDEARAVAKECEAGIETDWRYGRLAHTIVEYASEHEINNVVMGSHGRGGLERLLVGSVTETTIRRAPVPVTVVPEGSPAPER